MSDTFDHEGDAWDRNMDDEGGGDYFVPFHRKPMQYGPGPCPRCGKETVARSGPYGPFWGCCTYPKCKGVRKPKCKGVRKPDPNPEPPPKPAATAEDLGDGVYIKPWTDVPGGYILYTDMEENEIFLKPEVVTELRRYLKENI